jgi:vacuolar iron transporter family protein
VSVSSHRDSEKSLLARERRELREMPAAELDELAAIYEAKGVSPQTAAQVAAELTAHDALAAHVDAELRLDPDDLANPLQPAPASAASFTVGALLPLISDVSASITFVAMLIALGWRVRSAHVSEGATSATPCCGW